MIQSVWSVLMPLKGTSQTDVVLQFKSYECVPCSLFYNFWPKTIFLSAFMTLMTERYMQGKVEPKEYPDLQLVYYHQQYISKLRRLTHIRWWFWIVNKMVIFALQTTWLLVPIPTVKMPKLLSFSKLSHFTSNCSEWLLNDFCQKISGIPLLSITNSEWEKVLCCVLWIWLATSCC